MYDYTRRGFWLIRSSLIFPGSDDRIFIVEARAFYFPEAILLAGLPVDPLVSISSMGAQVRLSFECHFFRIGDSFSEANSRD